jgi:hypothetical protein
LGLSLPNSSTQAFLSKNLTNVEIFREFNQPTKQEVGCSHGFSRPLFNSANAQFLRYRN